jgi:hypothetical protein
MRDPGKKLIATHSLSTLIAAMDKKETKNRKTRIITRTKRSQITLLWVPSHVGIPENEKADSAAREALDEHLDITEEYPSQDLANWITEQQEENQQTQWEQNGSEMRNRKPQRTKRNDTSEMKRRDQVVISRLRTGLHQSHTLTNY